MVTDIQIFDDVAYSGRSGASYKLNAIGAGSFISDAKATPSSPIRKDPDTTSSIVASWGTDNLRPQNILKALEGLPQAKAILKWKAMALYGGGLTYGIEDENGVFTKKKFTEVEEFFRQSNIKRWQVETCLDYYWFENPFNEVILNGGRKIVSLVSQDSMYCRLGLQNPKTGLVEKAFINANWDNTAIVTDKDGIEVIDPYFGRFDKVKNGKAFKYIYTTSFPSPGKVYYQEAAWHGLVESGWLEVAKSIPKFKQALFKNQITIKYHIEIATWYWEFKYSGEWEKFSPEVKRDKIKDTIAEIDATLSGEKNAGKSVSSYKKIGDDGKEISAVTIHTLDDKIKDGVYIEDSQEAFSNIMFSMNTDPTLVGNAPGKNMGAGSGSDKRVAFNIYMLNCKADQDIILEPLEFIRDYNGWDPNIKFMFNNYYIATLDQGKEVSSTGTQGGNNAV
jgi:hypothetical protein